MRASRHISHPAAQADAQQAGAGRTVDCNGGSLARAPGVAVAPDLGEKLPQIESELRRVREELHRTRAELEQRRQTEAALLTTETRLRLVMEAANIGFWEWDARSNTVYHSPEWKRQLGYDDHEITNDLHEWQSRIHPDDQGRVQLTVDQFLKEGHSAYELEFRLRHRDGTYRWIRSQGRLLSEAGEPSRLLGVHVDITASKLREAQLRESEQRFRRLVETTHIIPWEADARTWQYTYVGPRSPLILGYQIEEWLSEEFWVAHLHPDDRAGCVEFRRAQARACGDFESEYRMMAADGRVVWFHDVVHVRRLDGAVEKLQGFLVDISERRRAAEEHARLAAIVESSNDAIIGETLEGTITSWNKSAERIYGYTASEVLGRSVRMLVPRERIHEVTHILARMKCGEIIEQFETLRLCKDGRKIHVSLVVSPIRDATGQITGASAIARDITERKELEAEVLQISEREQQRIARDLHDGLGQLLSGTVHLSTVLQLELAEGALPEAAEALRITELLNQAVAETRSLARGLYPVRPESNGLMAALEELAVRTRELFKISCEFVCPEPVLIEDNAVATHLYRMAQEAVTNALKHGRAGRIKLALSANPQRILLSVKDNGFGLSPVPAPRKGMGIRIMQYRAGMINAELKIQNGARSGVHLVCTLHRRAAALKEAAV